MTLSLNQAQRNILLVGALLLVLSILFLPYRATIKTRAIGNFLDPRPPQVEQYEEWGVCFLPWGLPRSGNYVRNYKFVDSEVHLLWPVLVVEWLILAIAVVVGVRMFANRAQPPEPNFEDASRE